MNVVDEQKPAEFSVCYSTLQNIKRDFIIIIIIIYF